jgi:RHS repeat-associated protein
MKEFYICSVERLGHWIDEGYLGCYSRWGLCGVVELPEGLGHCTSYVSGVACSLGLVELSSDARRYELSDWLGGVRVVITDRRIPIRGNNQVVVGYRAEVVSVTDYYSFGAEISLRSYEAQPWYRYGYQAQEKDNEIYGKGAMYHYTYRQHDARLGRFWSVDPLARKYPWNSPYAFAENDVVSSVELEGLERVQFNIRTSLTFGGDSRLRGLGYLNLGVGLMIENGAGYMVGTQYVGRVSVGGLGASGQGESVRGQSMWSIAVGYGQGNAPEMELPVFHSRMPSLLSTSREKVVMLAMNYVADGERSQWVGAVAVRRGDGMVNIYNDFIPGRLSKPPRDEYETGGGQVSILCRSCPGGIRTVNLGTEVFTSKRKIKEDGKESKYPKGDREYYHVESPQENIGWWYLRLNGEWGPGNNWTVGGYALGGNAGMAFQNKIHDWIKNPRFESPHPLGAGLMVGVGQTVRIGP